MYAKKQCRTNYANGVYEHGAIYSKCVAVYRVITVRSDRLSMTNDVLESTRFHPESQTRHCYNTHLATYPPPYANLFCGGFGSARHHTVDGSCQMVNNGGVMKEEKIGDVVELLSGSPKMTVRCVSLPWVDCDWFDDSGNRHVETFDAKQLKGVV